jgi:hypothetical protein
MLIVGLPLFLISACGGSSFVKSTAMLPPSPATALVMQTFTIAPITTASPIPTATWVAQGPDTINVPILLYHHIDISPTNSQYYVSPDKFEEQMKLLRDWEYTTITTEMLVKAIRKGSTLPPRPILVTFDDGNLDNYTIAFPIMQNMDLPARFI